MKDLNKYIKEKLVVNKDYSGTHEPLEKIYDILEKNYTARNSWISDKKNIVIGEIFSHICESNFKDYVSDINNFIDYMFGKYKRKGYPVDVTANRIFYVKNFNDFTNWDKNEIILLLKDFDYDMITIQPDFTQVFNIYYEKGEYLIIMLANMDSYLKKIKNIDSMVVVLYK